MDCPICGAGHATCGGPSTTRPVDLPADTKDEVPKVAEREMVMVHVDDGTDRGQDFKYERADAEKLVATNRNARIVGDEKVAEVPATTPRRAAPRSRKATTEAAAAGADGQGSGTEPPATETETE